MSKKVLFIIIILFISFLNCAVDSDKTVRVLNNFDFDWKFAKGDFLDAKKPDFDDTQWKDVNLPHDWMIEEPVSLENPSNVQGGFYPGGIGWYRKSFKIGGKKNSKIYIQFDGINYNSDVWVNGEYVGSRFYGYVSHYYDITPFIHYNKNNIITVRVDASQQPNDRWYSGAGIYRHAWLSITDKLHVPIWGSYITTPVISYENALVQLELSLRNDNNIEKQFTIATLYMNEQGSAVGKSQSRGSIPANSDKKIRQNVTILKPNLWSPDTPHLYKAVSLIFEKNKLVDKYVTSFGIRSTFFSADSGFILNGKKTILKGVCIHHDGGSVGAAVPDRVWQRRLDILKEIGVNAIRFAHNPHAPELLDMCDRMGFFVYDEMYDKWSSRSKKNNRKTEKAFLEFYEQDLADFINRDKNHPSVILWSVGNEVEQQLNDPENGEKLLQDLVSFVKKHDDSRMVTCALHPGNINDGHEVPSRLYKKMDVVSYNYRTQDIAKEWREKFPDYKWIASETKAYRTDAPQNWADINYSNNSWFFMKDFIAGQFIWAGFDYLGESRGWPDKGIRSGILYTTGFRKPYSYFTESIYKNDPMVHIVVLDDSLLKIQESVKTWQESWYGPPVSDHWTFPEKEGHIVQVLTYTNCENVELYLNERLLGSKILADFSDRVIRWQVPYESGDIMAIGKNKDQEVCRHKLETAGKSASVLMLADKSSLLADGKDLCHVIVQIIDDKGIPLPRIEKRVEFELQGPGRIIGIDNGDMSDHFDPKGTEIVTRNGSCLVLVQSTRKSGDIFIKATSEGLQSSESKILTH